MVARYNREAVPKLALPLEPGFAVPANQAVSLRPAQLHSEHLLRVRGLGHPGLSAGPRPLEEAGVLANPMVVSSGSGFRAV